MQQICVRGLYGFRVWQYFTMSGLAMRMMVLEYDSTLLYQAYVDIWFFWVAGRPHLSLTSVGEGGIKINCWPWSRKLELPAVTQEAWWLPGPDVRWSVDRADCRWQLPILSHNSGPRLTCGWRERLVTNSWNWSQFSGGKYQICRCRKPVSLGYTNCKHLPGDLRKTNKQK